MSNNSFMVFYSNPPFFIKVTAGSREELDEKVRKLDEKIKSYPTSQDK